ncbi:MAG: hypothetical protein ACI4KR_03870 [Ruminiclostridium sp.]
MKKFIFSARVKKTGEEFTFTFDDLYGYEGETEGVFIRRSIGKIRTPEALVKLGYPEETEDYISEQLNFNSGSDFKGMNPDIEIYDVKVIEE